MSTIKSDPKLLPARLPDPYRPPRRRTMLMPVAYSESLMPSMRLARSSRMARRFSHLLMAALVFSIVVMAFAPWQQSITGNGNVVAFEPLLRQQTIESPIRGRIVQWGEGIHENVHVRKGQLIVEIRDLDDQYADRLRGQLENARQALVAVERQLEASQQVLDGARMVVEVLEKNVAAFQRVKVETTLAQNALVESAEQRVLAEEQQLAENQAAIPQLEAQLKRVKILQEEGNISLQTFEQVERALREAEAKVGRSQVLVTAAQADLEARQRDRNARIDTAQVDVDRAEAELRRARQTVSVEERNVAKTEQDVQNGQRDILNYETMVARQQTQLITAPFDGFLVQLTSNLGTRVLKEGDPIGTIVPDTEDRAVQLWLNGNDAPLVEPGRHVRLQFEGWPAVQFVGWPSVAVGTFGGEVVSVDSIDDGRGNFRALVRPDPTDHPWPDDRFLRQGVRANGWVLLRVVPLWYEIWRQLNAFPPTISDEPYERPEQVKTPKVAK